MKIVDERSVVWRDRIVGVLGSVSSSAMLAWLASHRGRLRTIILGGRRLSVFIVWDTGGADKVDHSEADEQAIEQLVYGEVASAAVDPGLRTLHNTPPFSLDDDPGQPYGA